MPKVRRVIGRKIIGIDILVQAKDDVKCRNNAHIVFFETFHSSPRGIVGCALVVGVLALLEQVITAHVFAGDSLVEEIVLIDQPVLGGNR